MIKQKFQTILKKRPKTVLLFITLVFILLCSIFLFFFTSYFQPKSEISKLRLDSFGHKLMIVAHPDDESIFGGNELSKGDYVVICVTNGNNPIRRQEFRKAIQATHNMGIILTYPDVTNGERDNWSTVADNIYKEIEKAVKSKDWEKIVTHNPDGEYGHIHHKMVNQIVTAACKKQKKENELYYFGRYFKKDDLADHPTPTLTPKEIALKQELVKNYPSQKRVVIGLSHILPYEELIRWDEY